MRGVSLVSTIRLLWVLCVVLPLQSTGLSQSDEPLDLKERVREANLIVVGKLSAEYTVGKNLNGGFVEIEQVLLGTVATNKPLTVQYAWDESFIPGIFSRAHTMSRTNKHICFLTNSPATQGSESTGVSVPVGKRRLASNGFEFLTDATLKETKSLIVERNRKR
jgi:hypothetical protein